MTALARRVRCSMMFLGSIVEEISRRAVGGDMSLDRNDFRLPRVGREGLTVERESEEGDNTDGDGETNEESETTGGSDTTEELGTVTSGSEDTIISGTTTDSMTEEIGGDEGSAITEGEITTESKSKSSARKSQEGAGDRTRGF